MGKKTKGKSNGGQKGKKIKKHFCIVRNFRKCEIFAPFCEILDFPAFSALLSFWFLICNAELDSNSTCLDRLDKFGINSFQNLQN